MKNLQVLFITVTLLFTSTLFAKPNLPPPVEDFAKLKKIAGNTGPFVVKEDFPKSYFLIPKNLPYLIGLSLYHPSSSELNLSKEQITALLKVKKELTSYIVEVGLKVKKLELEVVNDISLKHKSVKAQNLYAKVDEIAKLKADLTKAHLRCIEKVKSILSAQQYEDLLDYGIVNMF
jgi:hypothetical protein